MNRRSQAILLVFLVGVVAMLPIFFLSAKAPAKIATLPTSSPTTKKPAAVSARSYRGLPTRLIIPAINVDADIEYMGDTPGGDMASPNGAVNAGWYKYGPLPGEAGSAVIAGHVVGLKGEAGVFNHLDRLQPGDTFSVTDAKGQSVSFTVRVSKTYNPAQQASEVFNATTGTHLNLVTCAGDWDAVGQRYLTRLVVFADLTI